MEQMSCKSGLKTEGVTDGENEDMGTIMIR